METIPDLAGQTTYLEVDFLQSEDCAFARNILGYRLFEKADVIAGKLGYLYTGGRVVTAHTYGFSFAPNPAKLGEMLIIRARITATFKSSFEVEVLINACPPDKQEEQRTACHVFFIFTALDGEEKKRAVPVYTPQDEEGIRLRDAAMARRVALLGSQGPS